MKTILKFFLGKPKKQTFANPFKQDLQKIKELPAYQRKEENVITNKKFIT